MGKRELPAPLRGTERPGPGWERAVRTIRESGELDQKQRIRRS